MTQKYTSDQFWKLYEKLPQELKDAVSSEEAGDNIYNICKKYEITESLDQLVDYVGRVLIGLLPPNELQEVLEKEVRLKKTVAEKVVKEINRSIFYLVKTSLEKLYGIEITPPAQMKTTPSPKEKPATPTKEDTYREIIE